MPITLYADRNIYHLKDWLPDNVNLITFEPSEGIPNLKNADALVVRTVSKVNEKTLRNIPESLRFVGTASSGTDHVNIDYLENHGVHFASAAGCNARAVAEYIGTSLILWGDRLDLNIHDYTVGIVGVGHVGSELAALLDDMLISYVAYDPPREIREQSFTSASLDEVLGCDILTFHVPLTDTGEYATRHWLDAEKLANRSFDLVINASRGGVVDETALREAMNRGHVKNGIIDVWEGEPAFNAQMSDIAFLATPHIAGYSVQAKDNATRMMMEALTETLGLPYESSNNTGKEGSSAIETDTDTSLASILESINPIRKYDKELRSIAGLPDNERGTAFRKLRIDRPFREEYRVFSASSALCQKYPELQALGIKCH